MLTKNKLTFFLYYPWAITIRSSRIAESMVLILDVITQVILMQKIFNECQMTIKHLI